jgi:peroxiredoxin
VERRVFVLCAALALAPVVSARAVEPGGQAPNCELRALEDERRTELAEFRGSVLWVDFWASWCGQCAESFPFLDDMHAQLAGRGLRVIAVNLDEERDRASDFVSRHRVAFAQLADPDARCARLFGVQAMPAAYLVDRRGIVRHVHSGFRAGEADDLRRRVEALLDEGSADEAD